MLGRTPAVVTGSLHTCAMWPVAESNAGEAISSVISETSRLEVEISVTVKGIGRRKIVVACHASTPSCTGRVAPRGGQGVLLEPPLQPTTASSTAIEATGRYGSSN